MKKKHKEADDLKKHYKELIHEERLLSQKLENQHQLCSSLLKKVNSWKYAFDREQEKLEQKKEALTVKTKEKLEKQKLLIADKKLYTEVKKKSLKEITHQLKRQFSSPEEQKKYITDLFALIGENKQ